MAEGIEIVPLYLAAPRPTVERDGLILMVDDERFRLRDGRGAGDALGALPDLGCYPLSGAVESEADTIEKVVQEMLLATTVGAPGPGDRPRRRRREHGEEEAGGLFLMARLDAEHELIAADIGAYLARHRDKQLLRFITCGSVDDGKSTLIGRLLYDTRQIFDDQMASLEADSKRVGTQGAGGRFRAARRRALRRARAGHHDRRRLPLLRDRQAQVHRRRHAGARAIYPQHGHRRLDRRRRGAAGRCAQGRADPDPAAQLSSRNWSGSAASCWRSTRWTWSTTTATRSTRSSPIIAPSPRRPGSSNGTRSRCRG